MTTLKNTQDNKVRVSALKKISECKWNGNTIHDTLNKCLVAINLNAFNSGWYNPVAVKIDGLTGYYMVNQDGSLFFESRVVKADDNKFRIEELTMQGLNEFENLYREMQQF